MSSPHRPKHAATPTPQAQAPHRRVIAPKAVIAPTSPVESPRDTQSTADSITPKAADYAIYALHRSPKASPFPWRSDDNTGPRPPSLPLSPLEPANSAVTTLLHEYLYALNNFEMYQQNEVCDTICDAVVRELETHNCSIVSLIS